MKKLNWGIVGTGWIGHEMAKALMEEGNPAYGVASGSLESAQAFANEMGGIDHVYASFDELIADPNIDIVYLGTPHSLHYSQMKAALEAGKNVFSEKSVVVNDRELEECVKIAEEKGLVIMDGTTLLHMPLFAKLKGMIEDGALGIIKMIQVNFGSLKEYDPNSRFFSKALAGGGLLDIGVYAISFARWFMSSQPNVVLTTANYFETGVDESSGILLKNPDQEMAVISLTMRAKQPKRGIICGEKGWIEVDNYPRADKAIWHDVENGKDIEITAGENDMALRYEVRDMESAILEHSGSNRLEYVRDVMKLLSAVRNQWGMIYPFE